MKFTTKSASVLIAILASSTIGGAVVSADTGEAKSLESKATLKVDGEGDTGGPDEDGKIPDPETDDKYEPIGPSIVDPNKAKGPLKVESVSQLQFGEIAPKAGTIDKLAAPVYGKDASGKETTRGSMVVFADVRSDVYGYTLQAKMSQQFKNEAKNKFLDGSTISFKNPIVKPEAENTNTPGKFTPTGLAFELAEGKDGVNGESVNVFKAEANQGKGRYTLEFGQSPDFEQMPAMIGTGVKDTADKSVNLNIPMNTAANMPKGDYEAKITWTLATAE